MTLHHHRPRHLTDRLVSEVCVALLALAVFALAILLELT